MIVGGAGVRGYKAANYSREASTCEGQEFGAHQPSPPGSAALGDLFIEESKTAVDGTLILISQSSGIQNCQTKSFASYLMSHTHLHVCWYWLHAGRDENVLANLRQYGLEAHYVDMVVADAARCVWKPQEIFDAIVTDRELASFLTVL